MPRRGQYLKGGWADRSLQTVKQVVAALPADVTASDARKAVSAAYPFGERQYEPYKIWLRVTNEYLRMRFPELATKYNQKMLNRHGAKTRGQLTGLPDVGTGDQSTDKAETGQGELLGMEDPNGPAP